MLTANTDGPVIIQRNLEPTINVDQQAQQYALPDAARREQQTLFNGPLFKPATAAGVKKQDIKSEPHSHYHSHADGSIHDHNHNHVHPEDIPSGTKIPSYEEMHSHTHPHKDSHPSHSDHHMHDHHHHEVPTMNNDLAQLAKQQQSMLAKLQSQAERHHAPPQWISPELKRPQKPQAPGLEHLTPYPTSTTPGMKAKFMDKIRRQPMSRLV